MSKNNNNNNNHNNNNVVFASIIADVWCEIQASSENVRNENISGYSAELVHFELDQTDDARTQVQRRTQNSDWGTAWNMNNVSSPNPQALVHH